MSEPIRVLHTGHRVADRVDQWTATVRFGAAAQSVEPVASFGEAAARAASHGCDSVQFGV